MKTIWRRIESLAGDLKNVKRDWTKVTCYGQCLGLLSKDFVPNYTNEFLEWTLDAHSADPVGDQKRIAKLQEKVALHGGFHRLDAAATAEGLTALGSVFGLGLYAFTTIAA